MEGKIYPVILAGGSGTRLWPLSRELNPKQLLEINDDRSLVKLSVERCSLFTNKKPIIVTNEKQGQFIKTDLADKKVEFLFEPAAKNTAPAIAFVAAHMYKKDPDAILAILPSDHYLDEKALAEAVVKAAKAAKNDNAIVLIGIKPTNPETGYGYIELGENTGAKELYRVNSFREKPKLEQAKKYLKQGNYLWNAGMFVASAETLKKNIEAHLPALSPFFARNLNDEVIEDVYKKIESTSIDYGVIEKSKNLLVVKTDMIWSDLGNWGSIHGISKKDDKNNHYKGRHIGVDNEETLVYSNTDRLIATIGLKGLVVVDTEDATLICNKNKSQEVKKIVDELKKNDEGYLREHKTTKKPWGRYTILDEGDGFKVKFLHLTPGSKISLQTHQHRSEHWVVVKGLAKVTIHQEEKTLKPNESVFVPHEAKHRLENAGSEELTIVEVATGAYIEEDDIQRYDDIYERA